MKRLKNILLSNIFLIILIFIILIAVFRNNLNVDRKYNITSEIVGDDPRALEEYQEYLNLIKEYASHYDISGHVKDESKYSYGR